MVIKLTKDDIVEIVLTFFAVVQYAVIVWLIKIYVGLVDATKIRDHLKVLEWIKAITPTEIDSTVGSMPAAVDSIDPVTWFIIKSSCCVFLLSTLCVVYLVYSSSPLERLTYLSDFSFFCEEGKYENEFTFCEQSSGLDVVFKMKEGFCTVDLVSKVDGSLVPFKVLLASRNTPILSQEERMLDIITQIWS